MTRITSQITDRRKLKCIYDFHAELSERNYLEVHFFHKLKFKLIATALTQSSITYVLIKDNVLLSQI